MKALALFICLVVLSACAASKEIPTNEGDVSDTMRESPCACNEVDFNSEGFKWLS
jgi:hypothetical protein